MRVFTLSGLLGVCALLAATSALALRITGTSGADTLKGSASADVISGGAGADRLFGFGGNDVLTGGPGRDVLDGGAGNDRLVVRDTAKDTVTCGAGRDTVVADQRDVAKKDCESVLRRTVVDPDLPPPPPTPTPTPPPTPPPPTVVAVTAGSYKGETSTGNFVFFDVTPGRTVKGFRVNDFRETCDGPLIVYGPLNFGPSYESRLDASGSFREEATGNGSFSDGTPYKYTYRVTGTVQGSSASGTAYLANEFTQDGRLYRCATEQQTWTATKLP